MGSLDRIGMARLLREQDGVISRAQIRSLGGTPGDIERMLRRREMARIHPGVFVEHTGPLTARQAEWAAVLAVPGAALADASALARDERSRPPRVQVAVESGRKVKAPAGVEVRRVSGLHDRVRWNLSPPRMKPEEAAIRVAARAGDERAAVAVLADVLGSRLTTVAKLRAVLDGLGRCSRRALLAAVLDDLAQGACSVLEREYLARVERAHGLPPGRRQSERAHPGRREFRDVEYDGQGLVLELDGRLFHESTDAWDRDHERGLDDQVAGKESIRLTWGQVFDHPCRTARKVGAVLRRRGWTGTVNACGPGCGAVLAA